MCGVCVCWCLLLVGNGEEEKRREGRERDLLSCACACACALPLSQHTHTHCTHTPTPTHKHSFPPPSPSLSPLAGLACCHLPPLFLFLSSLLPPTTHTQAHTHKCMALVARCFPLNTPLTPKEEKEKGEEYSTQTSSHATQAHHTPLHVINNENKAGKIKKEKKNRCWK